MNKKITLFDWQIIGKMRHEKMTPELRFKYAKFSLDDKDKYNQYIDIEKRKVTKGKSNVNGLSEIDKMLIKAFGR